MWTLGIVIFCKLAGRWGRSLLRQTKAFAGTLCARTLTRHRGPGARPLRLRRGGQFIHHQTYRRSLGRLLDQLSGKETTWGDFYRDSD
jgi:hypothetical protein